MRTISRIVVIVCLFCSSALAAAPNSNAPVVLVFGDSLSAGYGLRPGMGWVNLLSRKLESEGYGFRVVNASVTGETSAGGLARLPRALLAHKPRVVVIELGGNDGLRALPVAVFTRNMERMIELCLKAKARVLLLGVKLPGNYGARYNSQFEGAFPALAKKYKVPIVPWFMSEVAMSSALMQGDGIHPNEQGQPGLLKTVFPALQTLLQK